MNRKIKSTLGLVALLAFILIAGGIFVFVVQKGKVKSRTLKLNQLNAQALNQETLNKKYLDVQRRVSVIDSALAARKYNVPKDIDQIHFYNFVNDKSANFVGLSMVNVEYAEKKTDKEFTYYEYKLTGTADYNDLFKLIYSIEESRELKKIKQISFSNQVVTDDSKIPNFMVNFTLVADVYFTNTTKYITENSFENNLETSTVYDAFFPLIRNDIPPNIDNLLEVQGAKLLAIIPEGAFLADVKGDTFLLTEGDPVYLGYLTRIDTQNNKVTFILNKGGIIEKINLQLEPEYIQKSISK
ncbi:MAG: hypothetical protein Q8903_10305 [Bacteroidota bacterium]|nr:hypothetical protein [Bacteroidota bacterium]